MPARSRYVPGGKKNSSNKPSESVEPTYVSESGKRMASTSALRAIRPPSQFTTDPVMRVLGMSPPVENTMVVLSSVGLFCRSDTPGSRVTW
jgi:hypothetical protein